MDNAGKDKVFQRDFMEPTGEDRIIKDRALLPTVMQVKKFGLKGRTKYTHLNDQDTSNYHTNPWHEGDRISDEAKQRGEQKVQKKRKLAGTGNLTDFFKKRA